MKPMEISIPAGNSQFTGNLHLVPNSHSLVIFAHGSGSSRLSTRNQYVASILQTAGISTFLFDLLTLEEEKIDNLTRQYRFDIPLLAQRLVLVTDWIRSYNGTKDTHIGYFGSSTGAAAALIAAAQLPKDIMAVVSRGGRPDMAEEYLNKVTAPTLLIVGELDYDVIALNKMAYALLNCTKEISIIEGATHLFEEPGTLEKVAAVATAWFLKFL